MNVHSADVRPTQISTPISVEDVGSLVTIEREWRDLERRGGVRTPFQSWTWCAKWCEATARGQHEELRLVAVREGGRLVLLWPLAVRSRWACRIAYWLGEPLTQYGDVVAEPSERCSARLEAAWRHIGAWRDIDAMEMRRVRSDAAVRSLLVERGAACANADTGPFVDFTAVTPDGRPAWKRSSRTRNTLRRRQSELARLGEVRFEQVDAAGAQVAAVREALMLKHAWLKERGGASVGLNHPATEAFLTSLAAANDLFVARLRVGEATAALEIGMRAHERYYSFLQAYDARFADGAPGRLLFWHLIERCPDLGVSLFDFLAPGYAHKQEWATGASELHDFIVPLTRRGQLAASYLARVKPRLKSIHVQLPASLRRLTAGLAPAVS
jgi:CelD/BcsL family acetyltransferase involved in cellulose biosynthesis